MITAIFSGVQIFRIFTVSKILVFIILLVEVTCIERSKFKHSLCKDMFKQKELESSPLLEVYTIGFDTKHKINMLLHILSLFSIYYYNKNNSWY